MPNCKDSDYDFVIYTDGGYSLCRDEGAFAYAILYDGKLVKSKAYRIEHETSNRAELKAILAGCWQCPEGSKILVRTDSQYSIMTLRGIWQRKKNADLFEIWEKRIKREKKLDIYLEWVKGHNGDMWNEYCDQLCTEAAGFDLNAEFSKYKQHGR